MACHRLIQSKMALKDMSLAHVSNKLLGYKAV
uniref:Uncharacterized protein n=1 Tax=Tetranychus urticae TaxID=32264 RepID=T1L1D7_TETUR